MARSGGSHPGEPISAVAPHGAAHCTIDAAECHKQRVTPGLNDAAAMLFDGGVDHLVAARTQSVERSDVIQPDQAAVADHVGVHHRDQLPPICRPSDRNRRVGPRHVVQSRDLIDWASRGTDESTDSDYLSPRAPPGERYHGMATDARCLWATVNPRSRSPGQPLHECGDPVPPQLAARLRVRRHVVELHRIALAGEPLVAMPGGRPVGEHQ
jgi:hypothetical protein